MSSLHPVSGEKIYIGAVLEDQATDFTETDFLTQTWTLIDGWSAAGKFGDTAALITTPLINRGRDIKQKGTRNAGSMQNTFAVIDDDAGQLALIAAANTTDNFAFKVEFNDAKAGVSATVTMTIATPGVVTYAGHGLTAGAAVKFTTTGALPTGITAGTTYYVKTVLDASTFTLAATKGGTVINTTGTQSGTHTITTLPTNTIRYFCALVMESAEVGGSANTVRTMQCTTEINSNIVNVPRL